MTDGESLKDKLAKPNDFYRLDYRTGAVFNQVTDERVQVIPSRTWRLLKKLLDHDFKEKGSSIMFEIGAALGLSFAEEMMRQITDPEVLARRLPDMAAALGWGVFSMVGDMRYGSRFTVSVANCIFCDQESPADSPQCDFLVGVIKGAADIVFGSSHRVNETRCEAMGDSVCLVQVEETPE